MQQQSSYVLDIEIHLDNYQESHGNEEIDATTNLKVKANAVHLLDRCQCVTIQEDSLQVSLLPHAHYEDSTAKILAKVTSKQSFPSIRLAAEHFAQSWCLANQNGLHNQPHLYIKNAQAYCQDATPLHQNVALNEFHFGAQVNAGLFRSYHRIINIGPAGCQQGAMQQCSTTTASHMYLDLIHDRNKLVIKFVTEQKYGIGYKLELEYNAIVGIIADPTEQSETLYLAVKQPVLVFEAANYNRNAIRNTVADVRAHEHWKRGLEFHGCLQSVIANTSCIAINFSSLMNRQISSEGTPFNLLYSSRFIGSPFFHMIGRLKSRTGLPVAFTSLCTQSISKRMVYQKQPSELVRYANNRLTFKANYAFHALLHRGFHVTCQFSHDQEIDHDNAFNLLLNYIWTLCQDVRRAEAVEIALERLLDAVDERRNISLVYAFGKLYEELAYRQARNEKLEIDIPRNCLRLRKVIVTPSRSIILPSEVLLGNRILRTFGHENAIRISFMDDNGWSLGNAMGQGWIRQKADNVRLYEDQRCSDKATDQDREAARLARWVSEVTVRNTLTNGVRVAGRTYEFLAWSNSQMREHGCYMFCGDENVSAETIRKWIRQENDEAGNSQKKNKTQLQQTAVAKLMARTGQCFTQAQDTIPLSSRDYIVEKDIKAMRSNCVGEKQTISDGVGRITREAAKEICDVLGISPVPSAFQVRFNGIKGMLTVCETLETPRRPKKLPEGTKIVFRDSMVKFHTNTSQYLEVVKWSMPCGVDLNKPLLMILDQASEKQQIEDNSNVHNKVCDHVWQLMEDQLFTIIDSLCDEDKAAAQLDSANSRINFMQLKACISITSEALFRSMLLAIHHSNLETLLNKLKIQVPITGGRTMFGVMDETDRLEYGEVFIQYSQGKSAGHLPTVHEGPVMVTKNPCIMPGDVRLLKAVDIPQLRHLVDVIVFPCRVSEEDESPHIPHPHEMAGSDLDGDEFSVFFDEDLHFTRNEKVIDRNEKSIEGTRQTYSDIGVRDMIDVFIKHNQMDSIGRISVAHLAMADRFGFDDPRCEEIAHKHSCQVDFPKTGAPPPLLEYEENPKMYPDFMEKDYKPMYRSPRLIGDLYRYLKKLDGSLGVGLETMESMELNENLLYDGWIEFASQAKQSMDNYNMQLQHLVDKYGIENEGALLSGHMTYLRRRVSNREKDDYSFCNTEKLIESQYNSLYAQFRDMFFEPLGGEDNFFDRDPITDRKSKDLKEQIDTRALKKASAWYAVAYGPENRTQFRSFAWIAWEFLCRIASRNLSQCDLRNSLHVKLGQAIQQLYLANIHAFLQFFQDLTEEVPAIKEYCNRNMGLEQICFALHTWASADELLNWDVVMSDICLLLIQFGIHYCGSDRKLFDITPQNGQNNPMQKCKLLDNQKGELLLLFMRFLASRQLRTQGMLGIRRQLDIASWLPVSDAALMTYHTVAVTGTFEALHLTEEADNVSHDFSELTPPIAVSLTCDDRCHDAMALVLKEDSGAFDVRIRRPDSWKKSLILVSACGNAKARQKIRDILLVAEIPPDGMENTTLMEYFTSRLGYSIALA